MNAKTLFAAIATTVAACTFGAVQMPEVVSHRGESLDRPENSMAAFRLAFERGVDGVECDVYCTSDGVPVIIHDSTTGRTAGSGTNLTVTSSTWDQLKDVRIGAFGKWIGTEWEGETLPKFEDYLALLSMNTTTKCIVELKGNGANNLVANVVAAVQAQPLATKDRVAFIAFDASLIRAVRAALPDYDALLLLSTVSDSAATINSKVAACNGTGVDIEYRSLACSSESEVAAVKAAGYKFWVWTCDSSSAAFALVKNGVESVTTNSGGEMKSALAALVAEAESREEIIDARFPTGATPMEPSAYAKQANLVGHFDGIRNAGADLPHDPTTRIWKNLVSGYPDAQFYCDGAVSSDGYWTGNGFFFDGKEAAALVSPGIDMDTGKAFTFQLVTTIDLTKQHTGNSTGSTPYKGRYPTYFGANTVDNGFYTDNNKTTVSKTLIFKANDSAGWVTGSTRPSISTWDGRYATGVLGGGKIYLVSGTDLTGGQNYTWNKNIGACPYSWAGKTAGTDRFIYGTYHAVRMYKAALTEDELVWNRIVDEVRYRGVVTNGTVVVASNRAGAEGTEASGMYYVNGNHTFTVPASVTIDGCVYEPTGYKLETYNASTKTWNFAEERTDLSFAYTNCAVNTGARITWNWRLVSGVKKIDADDYVYGGLVLGFDGIRNAGLGVAHDSAATTWKNLGSGSDATLAVFDAARGAGAWTADGYDFAAGSCFVTDVAVPLVRQSSVQFAVAYNAGIQLCKWPSFFGPCDVNSDLFNGYTYTALSGAAEFRRGDCLQFNTTSCNDISVGVQPWDGRFANAIVDDTRSSVSNVAGYAWTTGRYKADIGSHQYAIGSAQSSNANRKDRAYKGAYHAFRLYDRVLTEAEIAHNLEIDNVRYYAGASRSSDTNVVEVAVESPGGVVTVDEKGSWIVRGEGASRQFTAPATVTVGNNTYSCTGYRIETWNAAKRMWESPVETGDLMVELRSTNSNRRLTWLYALTSGIRSAADYDVGDYVQQGLVANYDGIRNFGPSSPHGTLSQYWLDSSYRDVPMVAASNTAFTAWIGKGHRFTAADVSFFEMVETISLGQAATIQAVLDTVPTSQTTSYPLYFGFGYQDRSFFTRAGANRTRLEVKYPDWIGDNLYCTDWEGKYFTSVISPTRHYLIQGTELGEGTARTVFNDIPANKMAIGAPSTYPTDYNARKIRCMSGDYYALRIYNRALTEAELAHNRTVDEIRYRGNFTNANVTVVCEVPFEGVEAPVAVPAGDYEVAGTFTFTASGLTVGESTFPVRYTVETWDGTAWGEPVEYEGGSYAYTAGAKVRLTWKWADPTVPVKATWTGAGDVNNLLDPANWSCVNALGEAIVAAPGEHTSVTICGTTAFSIPEGVTAFPWKDIRFADTNAHAATRLGSLELVSNAGFAEMGAGYYTLAPAADAVLSGLNGGSDGGPHETWQKKYVRNRRGRFDGWINVTAAQAGTWEIRQGYDDYFGFAIDGEWLIVNNTYIYNGSATVDVSAGWHRFTIVCGDTSGGYGSTDTCSIVVNGEHVPLAITAGGNIISFTGNGFAFGSGAPGTITLSGDCDWSALGNALVADGTTIDLNGHNLSLSSISSDYVGTVLTNSNDAVQSVVTFTAPEGKAVTNGVAICGNVKVVKKGAGTYYAYAAASSYSGGTFIDAGKAQPPDGNGTDDIFCWDKFKAFGTGEIHVAYNAVFDLRANYAYRNRVILDGGSLVNTKADMTATGNGGSGIGRLTADSYLGVTNSIVFGDNNGKGDMDLGGHTLTTWIGTGGKYLYLRCSKIENGKIDIRSGGWLQVVNACVATNVDFKVNCALNIGNTLSVRDYEAAWASNTKSHNAGTAALNVYGTFTPSAGQKFCGCTMQDGSTIDLSAQSGAFSTLSYYTGGSTNIKFAANANVTVNLAGRTDLRTIMKSENPYIVTWPEGLGPAASVTFAVDAETKQMGLKVVRDDEHNALRLVRSGGFMLIVR